MRKKFGTFCRKLLLKINDTLRYLPYPFESGYEDTQIVEFFYSLQSSQGSFRWQGR